MAEPQKTDKLTLEKKPEAKAIPLPTSPQFIDWCRSDERIANLRKELDKRYIAIRHNVPDAKYDIDLELNTINFLGGPEKNVSTTLIQKDSAIFSLFTSKRLYYTREYKQSVGERMEKVEKLLGGDPDKLDKLIAALEKMDSN